MLFLKIGNKYLSLLKARGHKYYSKKPDGKGGYIYTYKSIDINSSYKKDQEEFGEKQALRIYLFTEGIRKVKDAEHSKFYNEKGIEIFTKSGNEKNIFFTENELNKIDNARLFVHNHPSADSFSPNDIQLLLEENIKEMRSCGQKENRKTDFSLQIIKNIPFNEKQKILDNYTEIWIGNKILAKANLLNWFAHVSMLQFIKQYGEYFEYKRIK